VSLDFEDVQGVAEALKEVRSRGRVVDRKGLNENLHKAIRFLKEYGSEELRFSTALPGGVEVGVGVYKFGEGYYVVREAVNTEEYKYRYASIEYTRRASRAVERYVDSVAGVKKAVERKLDILKKQPESEERNKQIRDLESTREALELLMNRLLAALKVMAKELEKQGLLE